MTETTALHIPASDFTSRCQFIRKQRDYLLGDCALFKDKVMKKTILCKERDLNSESELQKLIKYSNIMAQLNACPSVAEFFYYTYKPTPHIGENSMKYMEFRQFFEHTLEREIASRLKERDVFTEEEVWRMTVQLISANATLQSVNLTHGHICPRTIFLVKENGPNAKVQWSDNHQSAFAQVMLKGRPLDAKCFLAPELLEAVKRKNRNVSYNAVSADVFSLGINILGICTLGDIDDLYNLKQKIIDVPKLKSKLGWVKSIYSERLYFVLDKMLKINPNKRSDFRCLVDIIDLVSRSGTIPEEPGSPLSPSIVKRQRSMSPSSMFGASSIGRRTVDFTSACETRNGRSPSKWSESPTRTPFSARSPMSRSGFKCQDFSASASPTKSFKSVRFAKSASLKKSKSGLSPVMMLQRASSTVSSLFDKKTSPLVKEGYVSNELLLKELEKKLIMDPVAPVLKTGMVKKLYSDGSRYEGNTKGKIRERIGINYYGNGDVYAGEWKNDKFNGRGVYFFENGERYEGQLVNGHKKGQGVFYYANQSKYMGEWKDDKKHGKGAFFYADSKEKYEGDWDNGMRHGEGLFTFATGDEYTGSWEHDHKSGKGTLLYSDDSKYEGDWMCNVFHGFGVMEYKNGDKYEGSWEDGAKSGKGTYYYQDGSQYEGDWNNGEKNGIGTLTHPGGEKYEGEWKDSLKCGQGLYYYQDGSIYEGWWQNDLKHGAGTLVQQDGTSYEGQWVNGERSGKGVMRLSKGDVYEGEFKKDVMNGMGSYQWSNGDMFQGQWVKNKMHGQGMYVKKNGERVYGLWESQKLVKASTTEI